MPSVVVKQMQPHSATSHAVVHDRPDGHTLLMRLLVGWKRLQVSYYGGKYSIHRVLALDAYTITTPLWRAILVCLASPLPIIAFVIAQESIPLQDPRDGWRANYGFWMRAAILAFIVANTLTNQASYLIDGVSISVVQLVLVSASWLVHSARCLECKRFATCLSTADNLFAMLPSLGLKI